MTTTAIGFEVTLAGPFDAAITSVIAALKDEGFGVLTEIDLKEAFRDKIGVDFHDYVILGACNPHLAHRALSAHPEIGLMLPCNVTVEQGPPGRIIARITDPAVLFGASGLEGEPEISAVVDEARERLSRVAAALSAVSVG